MSAGSMRWIPGQPFWKYFLQYFENVYQFDTKIGSTLGLLFLYHSGVVLHNRVVVEI